MIKMTDHIFQLIKESIKFGLPMWLSSFIGVIMLPIVTQYLTPSDYGSVSIMLALLGFAQFFLLLGVENGIAYYFTFSRDNERKIYVSSAIMFIIISTSIFVVFFSIFREPISFFIFKNNFEYVYIVILLGSLFPINYFIQCLLRWSQRQNQYLIINFLIVLLFPALSIFFLVFLKYGLYGYLLTYLITYSCVCFLGVFFIKDLIIFDFNFNKLYDLIVYGFPLIFVGIGQQILDTSGKIFINIFLTLSDVGIYSIGLTIASGITIIIQGFKIAWGPYIFNTAKNDILEVKNIIKIAFIYYIAFISLFWLILSLFSLDIITLLTNKEYIQAYTLIPIFAATNGLIGLYYILTISCSLTKDTHLNSISFLVGVLVNIISTYFLIQVFGIYGVAFAAFFGFLSMCIVMNFFGRKVFYIDFNYKKSLTISISAFLIYLIIWLLEMTGIILFILKMSGIFIFLILIVYLLNIDLIIILKKISQFRLPRKN